MESQIDPGLSGTSPWYCKMDKNLNIHHLLTFAHHCMGLHSVIRIYCGSKMLFVVFHSTFDSSGTYDCDVIQLWDGLSWIFEENFMVHRGWIFQHWRIATRCYIYGSLRMKPYCFGSMYEALFFIIFHVTWWWWLGDLLTFHILCECMQNFSVLVS